MEWLSGDTLVLVRSTGIFSYLKDNRQVELMTGEAVAWKPAAAVAVTAGVSTRSPAERGRRQNYTQRHTPSEKNETNLTTAQRT